MHTFLPGFFFYVNHDEASSLDICQHHRDRLGIYKMILLHLHRVLHPITLCYIRSAVMLLGLPAYAFSLFTILGLSTIAISDSISAKDVTSDCSMACICFVH